MRERILLGVTLAVCIAFGGVLLDQSHLGWADHLMVTAKHVEQAPSGLDDPVWQETWLAEIPVKGRGGPEEQGTIVRTRAVYTDDSIYFLFRWKDPTRSVTKEAWKFDGEKWGHLKGNEDRIALLFEITRINKFATKGCAVTCHSPADLPREEWKFATQTAAEKGDLWHWKAARSDPYNYADDAWLTLAGNPTGSYRTTGRRKDVGEGGDIRNETDDKSRPLYMQDPVKGASVPGFLLFEEAIKIPDYTTFKAGDTVTYRMPKKPSGSRFDVKALSRYADDGWTVMLYRKLDTGHEDDIAFNPKKNYSFAMALFDDSGADHSKATKAMTLRFSR